MPSRDGLWPDERLGLAQRPRRGGLSALAQLGVPWNVGLGGFVSPEPPGGGTGQGVKDRVTARGSASCLPSAEATAPASCHLASPGLVGGHDLLLGPPR